MKIPTGLAIGLFIYVMYRMRVLQNALSAAQSMAPSANEIQPEYDSVADNFMSPMNTYHLIQGTHEEYTEPGPYGVTQTNVISVNGTKIPTFGRNYSKSFI